MGHSKNFLLAVIFLVVTSIAIAAVIAWGYFSYLSTSKKQPAENTATVVKQNGTGDSGMRETYPVINSTPPSSEDTADELQKKLEEFSKLQAEIQALIDNRKGSEADSASVHLKQLQESIQSLEEKNQRITEENKKLLKTVDALSGSSKRATTNNTTRSNKRIPGTASTLPVLVSNLNLYALTGSNSLTTVATAATSLRCSFNVLPKSVQSGELMAVVIKPDGKVLPSAPWESGFFDTPDSKKMYSTRIHFNANDRQLSFSIEQVNLKRGTYILELYYNGGLLASLRKSLQ